MVLKQLFRSSTDVFIPDNIEDGVLEAIEVLGKGKILLMADRSIVDAPSFIKVKTTLEKSNLSVRVHIVDVREPDVVWVDEQVKEVKDFCPDIVVGVGGGSLIDLAKAVSVLIYNEGSAADYQGPNLVTKPGAKKIMIPTTAGTGSEVTSGAVVLNRKTGRKGAIGSPFVTPDIAILDPSLTLSMPSRVMASTAMDVIAHCIESYVGKAVNPFAKMYAREGLKYLINSFQHALDDSSNLEIRLNMLIGSTMGGFAIFNTDTGASHSMSYPLGTYYKIPHGIANALLLPLVIEHNIDGGCYRYSDLYDMIENRDVLLTDAKEKSVALLRFIENLIIEAKFNVSLREYGLGEYNISDMAEKGLTLKTALNNNPVNFSNDDAISILKRLI